MPAGPEINARRGLAVTGVRRRLVGDRGKQPGLERGEAVGRKPSASRLDVFMA